MLKKFQKIVFLLLLIGFVLSFAAPVFALELRYPSLPGIGALEEGQPMGFYAKYFINLAFFIAAGISIIVLVVGGILHIIASQKPATIVKARSMIQRALLGLFILITSYLVLYAINPQLLTIKWKPEPAELEEIGMAEYPPATIGYVAVPFLGVPLGLGRVVWIENEEKGVYVELIGGEFYYTDGYSNPVDPDTGEYLKEGTGPFPYTGFQPQKKGLLASLMGSSAPPNIDPQNFVYQAEILFKRTEKVMAKVLELIEGKVDDYGNIVEQGIPALLENCKCGDSYFKIIWEGIKGKCITHMGYLQGVSPEKGGQAFCLNLCDDCGTKKDSQGYFLCDIREVRIGPVTVTVKIGGKDEDKVVELTEVEVKEGTWKYLPDKVRPIGWEPSVGWKPGKWDDPETGETKDVVRDTDKVKPERLIKYKLRQLEGLLAELKAQEPQFAAKQFDFLADTLRINAADFLLAEGDIRFGYDFAAQKEYLESYGFDVQVETPKHLEPEEKEEEVSPVAYSRGVLASLAALVNPFLEKSTSPQLKISPTTAYMVIYGPPAFVGTKAPEENREVLRQSQRASLFSVLTGLPLEAIEKIFKDCLTLAFGVADYQLPEGTTDIITQAIREGVAGRFITEAAKWLPEELSGYIADGMTGEIYKDGEINRVIKCAERCGGTCDAGQAAIFLDTGVLGTANKECVQKCLDESIPSHIVSETIADFFTKPLKEKLPDSIQETLDEKLRETIFTDRLNEILDSEMVKLYNKVLHDALTKSFVELIPHMQEVLNKRLDTVPFLDKVFKVLNYADKFLKEQFAKLKTEVSKLAKSLADGLKQATVGKIEGAIQGYKQKHPEDFPEYLPLKDCYARLYEGWHFVYVRNERDEKNRIVPVYECQKMSPEYINNELRSVLEPCEPDQGCEGGQSCRTQTISYEPFEEISFCYYVIDEREKETLCRGMGQCWQKDRYIYLETNLREGVSAEVGAKCCYDGDCNLEYSCVEASRDCKPSAPDGRCTYNENVERKLTVGKINPRCVQCSSLELTQAFTKENREKWGRDFKAGLVNFGEQLLNAFWHIMTDTAIKYAQVWIEDTVLTPLRPYLQEVSDFQDGFHKFLNATVQDVLPEVVNKTLQSNIDKALTDVCKQYKKQKAENPDLEEITFDVELYDLGEHITWKEKQVLHEEVGVPEGFGERACQLSTHFHTKLLDEIAGIEFMDMAKVKDWLNASVQNHLENYFCPALELGPNCIENFLSKTPAEMLWPQWKNILEIIQGTPKKFICGEIALEVEGWGSPDMPVKPIDKCRAMRANEWGIFPSFNTESAVFKAMSEEDRKKYIPWCYFIYNACESPFSLSVLNKPTGEVVEILTAALCHKINKDAVVGEPEKEPPIEPKCKGSGDVCLGAYQPNQEMRDDPTCPRFHKIACETCNVVLHNPVAFSVYYHAVKEIFDLTKYGITDHTYPQKLIADSPLAELKAKEKKAYQFLLAITPDRASEIEAVAKRRGFRNDEWAALVAEKRDIDYFNDLKEDLESEDILIAFINYFTTEMTPRELLMRIPLGVIKPIGDDEKTLLGTEKEAHDYNFLALTFYQLFEVLFSDRHPGMCAKIEDDFARDYPDWTMERLEQADWADLYSKKILPYSMESLENPTIAKRFDAIFQAGEIDEARKLPYLFCVALDYSPAQILGLDQFLYTYVRPREYQILFQLLEDKLTDEERPEALSQVLSFMFDKTPLEVFSDIENALGVRFLFSMPWKDFYGDQLNGKALRIVIEQEVPPPDFWKMLQGYWDGLDRRAVIPDDDVILGEVMEIMDEYGAQVVKDPEAVEAGVPIVPMDLYMRLPLDPPLDIEKTDTNVWLIKDSRGRQYQAWQNEGVLKVYQVTREGDYASIQKSVGDIAAFLRTPLRSQIIVPEAKRPKWSQVPIIDLLIEDYCAGKHTEKKDIIQCINKFHRAVPMDKWKDIQAFLGQTPIQILKSHLTKPLVPELLDDENMSLMGRAAKSSFLGQPYLDTLGRGWLDEGFFWLHKEKAQAYDWVDRGINKKKDQIKKGFDKAFIEAPKFIGRAIVDGIAKLIGKDVGRGLADAIVGACYEASESECLTGAGEVFRIKDGVGQCCDMGKSLACQPRCVISLETGEDCIEPEGETYNDIENLCCYQIVDDKCKKCRKINAAQGAKCRKDEETLETIDGFKVCCHEEQLIEGETVKEDMCCQTVLECVANEFAAALEVMADMLADGVLPLDSLID